MRGGRRPPPHKAGAVWVSCYRSAVCLCVNGAEAELTVLPQVRADAPQVGSAPAGFCPGLHATDKPLHFLFSFLQYQNYRFCGVSLPLNYSCMSQVRDGTEPGVPPRTRERISEADVYEKR